MPKSKSEKGLKKRKDEQPEGLLGISADKMLLKGPMPDLSKMKLTDLKQECQMWRNVWGWVPSEVKYYVARVGQQVGVTMRNYKRYLGVLLDTHWDIYELELGVYERFYDTTDGKYYFERKIVKTRATGILDLQWIKERVEAEETTPSPSEPPSAEETSASTPANENSPTV